MKTIYIDASSLKSHSLCDRRYLLTIIRGYSTGVRAENYKAGYGTAFHKGLELYYSIPPGERLQRMGEVRRITQEAYSKYLPYALQENNFRTAGHLDKSLTLYHERYHRGDAIVPLPFKIPGATEDSHLLEQKFSLPWYQDPDGRFTIFLTGTIDLIGNYFNRMVIWDHKSTSTPRSRIDQFFQEFNMNIQTQLYTWLVKKLIGGDEYLPVMINGIFIKGVTAKAEKEGIFDGVHFQRSQLIEYTPAQMAQFEQYLKKALEHIVTLVELYGLKELTIEDDTSELGSPDYAACHGRFSSCSFCEMCALPPTEQIRYLKSRFISEPYNPLAFND